MKWISVERLLRKNERVTEKIEYSITRNRKKCKIIIRFPRMNFHVPGVLDNLAQKSIARKNIFQRQQVHDSVILIHFFHGKLKNDH